MKGKWISRVRRAHMLLSVFFTPLLLLFILTGWWQTVTSDEEKEREGGWVHTLIQRLSTVHTDSYFPPRHLGGHDHLAFKVLVVTMCVGLIGTVVMGLLLASQVARPKWLTGVALLLGIAVPVLLLWLT